MLPEPLLTSPDVAEDVELAESVSMALLVVLETLAPAERAVFVLREVFGAPYEEIAAAVGKSTDAVRQIAHRARRHVDARRPRRAASPGEVRAASESLRRAVETRDLQSLFDVLAPDVVWLSDGGGVRGGPRGGRSSAPSGWSASSRASSARRRAWSPFIPPCSTGPRR